MLFRSSQDGFVASLDASTGALTQATQFGSSLGASGQSVLVDPTGDSVLSQLGLPGGSAPGLVDPNGTVVLDAQSAQAQIGARADQSLTIAVNGGLKRTVTLNQGDTLLDLANSINSVLGNKGTARLVDDGFNQTLQITATNGSQIAIGDGPQGFDLLPTLGLQAETIYAPQPASASTSTKPISPFLKSIEPAVTPASTKAASIFQLGFVSNIDLSNKQDAASASLIVQNAMIQVKKAYSFLTQGPTPPSTATSSGTVPTETTKQINQFVAAAQRLGISYSGSGGYASGSAALTLLQAGYSGVATSAAGQGAYSGYTAATYSSALTNFVQPIKA